MFSLLNDVSLFYHIRSGPKFWSPAGPFPLRIFKIRHPLFTVCDVR